jgi:DNA-binding NarL/FixJ family response regulator
MACRIAICDDVRAYRELLTIAFSVEHDIEVVGEAATGEEAIELVRREQPDVLLLDVAMPKMDGLEALPQVVEAAPATRVIMLTGFARAELRERALAGGAFGYLEKGATPRELADAVRSACAT